MRAFRARGLERRLERAVRAAVAASPALLAERKRLRSKHKQAPEQQQLHPAVWALIALGTTLYAFRQGGLAELRAYLALHGLVALAAVWLHGRTWLQQLFSGELEVFVTLPAGDGWLFDRLRRGTRRDAVWWLLALGGGAGGAAFLAARAGADAAPGAIWLVLLTGALWAGVRGLGPLLAWRKPGWASHAWLATAALVLTTLGAVWTFRRSGSTAPAVGALTTLGALCPLGWPGMLGAGWLLGGSAAWALGLVPACGLLPLRRWVVPAWRRAYSLTPLLDPATASPEMVVEGHVARQMVLESEFNEELVEQPALEPWVRSQVRASVGRAVTLAVEEGEWRARPTFQGGLTGVIGRLLGPRRQLVAHMLRLDLTGWSRQWQIALILLGLGGGLTVAGSGPAWLGVGLLVIAALVALPVLGGTWEGLELTVVAGGAAPLFAFFPVTVPEVVSTILRVNAVRFVAYLPGALATGAALTLRTDGWAYGVRQGAVTWALLLALQPGAVALRLHENLVAHQLRAWHSLALIPLAVGAVVVLIAAGAGLYALPWGWGALILLGVYALSRGVLALTLRLLARRDLVRPGGLPT